MFSHDLFADIVFGRPLGFLKTGRDVKGIIECHASTADLHECIIMVPILSWLVKNTLLGSFLFPKGSDDFAYGFLEAVSLQFPDLYDDPDER